MIYFIGGGNGTVELLTVQGKNLLERADVVVAGPELAGTPALQLVKPSCRIFYRQPQAQDKEMVLLVEAAQRGKLAVGIYAGDALWHGVQKEQLTLLRSYKLPYLIVPGVSRLTNTLARFKDSWKLLEQEQPLIFLNWGRQPGILEKRKLAACVALEGFLMLGTTWECLGRLAKELLHCGVQPDLPVTVLIETDGGGEVVQSCPLSALGKLEAGLVVESVVLLLDFTGLPSGHTVG